MEGAGHLRHAYQGQLRELEAAALGGLDLVIGQLDRVTEALEQQDVELATFVIADDDRLDGRYLEVHQGILSMLARQAPVAGDLRLVAALLHLIKHIERMGDQCVNVAKLLPLSGNEPPRVQESVELVVRMARLARSETVQARQAFELRDVELARDIVRQDQELNRLNKEMFRLAIDLGDEVDVREWLFMMAMVARAFERVGDNAVDVAELVAFVTEGLFHEFGDAARRQIPPG